MSRYAILLQTPVAELASQRHAWQLASALLERGHQLPLLFVTGDAVLMALASADPAAGEWHAASAWASLAGIGERLLCASAAQRHGLSDSNIHPGFRIGGLGEWVTAAAEADRVIQWR